MFTHPPAGASRAQGRHGLSAANRRAHGCNPGATHYCDATSARPRARSRRRRRQARESAHRCEPSGEAPSRSRRRAQACATRCCAHTADMREGRRQAGGYVPRTRWYTTAAHAPSALGLPRYNANKGTNNPSKGTNNPNKGTNHPSKGTNHPSKGTNPPSKGANHGRPRTSPCTTRTMASGTRGRRQGSAAGLRQEHCRPTRGTVRPEATRLRRLRPIGSAYSHKRFSGDSDPKPNWYGWFRKAKQPQSLTARQHDLLAALRLVVHRHLHAPPQCAATAHALSGHTV